jgi:Sortase domain
VVLDGTSGPRMIDVRDAAGPSRTPRGGVETGLGGLAGRVTPPPWTLSARLLPLPALQTPGAAAPGTGAYTEPRTLRIPAIGVRTPLEPLATDARGRLRPPGDPARAGWFHAGVRPGDVGPAVIAGHVDSRTGAAVFTRLGSLTPGARILVTDARGRVAAFTVERTASFPKTRFPTEDVYGATPDPQLRLITCGGAFDPVSGHYRRDVVVYASLTP